VEVSYISDLLERMIVLLKTSVASERHLIYHIASGLEKMLQKSRSSSMSIPLGSNSSHDKTCQHAPQTIPMGQYQGSAENEAAQVADNRVSFTPTATVHWQQINGDDDQSMIMSGDNINNPMSIMNDGWIHEAFGYSEPATDVYNLLTSQFSY
jgi:hypothetical protein